MPIEPRKVTLACPDCATKMRLTVSPGDEGKRVTVRCQCGQAIRTRLPERPKVDTAAFERMIRDAVRNGSRNPFGL